MIWLGGFVGCFFSGESPPIESPLPSHNLALVDNGVSCLVGEGNHVVSWPLSVVDDLIFLGSPSASPSSASLFFFSSMKFPYKIVVRGEHPLLRCSPPSLFHPISNPSSGFEILMHHQKQLFTFSFSLFHSLPRHQDPGQVCGPAPLRLH